MPFPTIFRLAEEILKVISGGDISVSSNVSFDELKIAIGQKLNELLKIDYLNTNTRMGETIPNGTVLGTYDGITVSAYDLGRSKATLPIKPIKLPRNMGIFSVYRTKDPLNEFKPLQMGQLAMAKSQPLLNDLMGQIGYENFGMDLIFTKDLTLLYPNETLSMRLAIMDISQYDDYTILPILPEMEWQVKNEVIALYSKVGLTDMIVDPTTSQQVNVPNKQQEQA